MPTLLDSYRQMSYAEAYKNIRAQQLVETAAQELQGLKGQVGERTLRIFYRSLVQYTNRYEISR